MSDAVARLTAVLREADATPTLQADAVTFSATYDPVYRAAVIALTLRAAGKKDSEAAFTLPDLKLRLFQFVAVHTQLLPSLRGWVNEHKSGRRPSLDGWARFPRGYAADTLYERLTDYLCATGELQRLKNSYVRMPSAPKSYLGTLVAAADAEEAFQAERAAITEVAGLGITLDMLRS